MGHRTGESDLFLSLSVHSFCVLGLRMCTSSLSSVLGSRALLLPVSLSSALKALFPPWRVAVIRNLPVCLLRNWNKIVIHTTCCTKWSLYRMGWVMRSFLFSINLVLPFQRFPCEMIPTSTYVLQRLTEFLLYLVVSLSSIFFSFPPFHEWYHASHFLWDL